MSANAWLDGPAHSAAEKRAALSPSTLVDARRVRWLPGSGGRAWGLIVVGALIGLWPACAYAERRALLIANSAYQAQDARLDNPLTDVLLIKEALGQVGFLSAQVRLRQDLDGRGLKRAISLFAGSLRSGDEAFLYYAGHGVVIDGDNYLLGIRFDEDNEVDAKYGDVYPVAQLVSQLERSAARVRIVAIDACRNEPFTRSWSRSMVPRGFRVVRAQVAEGTLLAFAAGDGRPALDKVPGIDHGPFAHALASQMKTPNLDVRLLFADVRDEVKRLTGNRQQPEYLSKLTGRYYFVRSSATPPAAARPPPASPPRANVEPPPPPKGRKVLNFVISPDGQVVTDTRTGLMWMRQDFPKIEGRFARDWHEAMAWADKINTRSFGGYSDWRVPTIKEYRSINQNRAARRLYRRVFEDGGAYMFWSRNSLSKSVASYISFKEGFAVSGDKGGGEVQIDGKWAPTTQSVRLVRGGN